jgi:putative transposase
MLLCTKIRLQVTSGDIDALEFMQGKCRGLYNWWILRLREGGEQWPGWTEAKATLEASKEHDPNLRHVYGKLLQEVYFRLDKAMSAFFRRVKAGETPGFPRMRPRHAFFTLCYPAMYVKVEGDRLHLPTGGGGATGILKRYPNIVARLKEPAPATYREVAISRDACGNYYASFVAERPGAPQRNGGVVAFDLGIKTLATGVGERGRITPSAASRDINGTTASLTRSAPRGIDARRSHAATSTSRMSISVSPNASAANNVTVCTKPPISLPTDWLKAPW